MAENPSDKIQRILNEPDLWDTNQSGIDLDQSYSVRRWNQAKSSIGPREIIAMIAAAFAPLIAGFIFGSTTNLWNGIIAAIVAIVLETAILACLYFWVVAKEMDKALSGDLAAAKNQLSEERRKLHRVVNLITTEKESPNLVIDYRPQDKEPFVMASDSLTQYRIGVKSPCPVVDVEVVVNRFKTNQLPSLFDIHLRPMNDRDYQQGTKRVGLKTNKEAYWDLVCVFAAPEHGRKRVYLSCIVSAGVLELEQGDYEFEIMATGGDSPPATKLVNLTVNENYDVSELRII